MTSQIGESRKLSQWISSLATRDIPTTVTDYTKRLLLDNLACQVGGAALPWCQAYYQTIMETRQAQGKGATVVVYGDKLPPDEAAFLNSTFNHSNESDDTHLAAPTHPGAVAVPAALALAEYCGASGEQLLKALVAGFEVQLRIAWACSPHLVERGHHPPPGTGPFGAAAAGAILLGLDEEQTLNALAIAGSHSAGLTEYSRSGGSVKRIHCAIPAQAGVRAALFAQRGITGPQAVLEGVSGFCRVFAGTFDSDRLVGDLGSRYETLNVGMKMHSCCYLIHPALEALDEARRQASFTPESIRSIVVTLNNAAAHRLVGTIREPRDILGAQFSMAFSLSLRLHRGSNGFWDYREEDLADPTLLATAQKIDCRVGENLHWSNASGGAEIDVELMDGRRIRTSIAVTKGLPKNPLTHDEVIAKFRSIAAPLLPAANIDRTITAVRDLETLADLGPLLSSLVADRKPRLAASSSFGHAGDD